MNRRQALALLAAALVVRPFPAEASDRIPLADLARALEELRVIEARFIQVNQDGSQSGGRLFLQRPGRLRFEYDRPRRDLVIASGGQVAIFEGRPNSQPKVYPLHRTPLDILLAPRINLAGGAVAGHGTEGPYTVLVLQDPQAREAGHLRLLFERGPRGPVLRRWTTIDGNRQQTTVVLQAIEYRQSFSPFLFDAAHEVDRRQP